MPTHLVILAQGLDDLVLRVVLDAIAERGGSTESAELVLNVSETVISESGGMQHFDALDHAASDYTLETYFFSLRIAREVLISALIAPARFKPSRAGEALGEAIGESDSEWEQASSISTAASSIGSKSGDAGVRTVGELVEVGVEVPFTVKPFSENRVTRHIELLCILTFV
jgi:hypothetical protein